MSVVRSPFPDVPIPEVTFPDFVFADVATDGGRPALIDGPSGRTLTLAEVDAATRRFASGLRAAGLQPGEVVSIVLPNCVEYAAAFHGTVRAGGTAATANPLYTADELRYQFEHSGARVVVTAEAMAPAVREAAAGCGARVYVLGGDGDGAAAELFDHPDDGVHAPPADLDRDAVAILYSSGTSGRPKGVVLTHRNLVSVLSQVLPVFHLELDDTTIAVLPFFHIFGVQVVLNLPLITGARTVTMPRFDLPEFLRLIQEHRATRLFVVPPIALALARHPLIDQYDLSSLKSVLVGAAPLDAEVQLALEKRLGVVAVQGYGMTETSLAIAVSPVVGERVVHGAAGVLIPNMEARLDPLSDDDAGGDGPERGELCVRGPNIMAGYLGDPGSTAATIDDDGWMHTGDVATISPDGVVTIVDRIKELIKYKGFQVAPAELEGVLLTHPGVVDCAVIGTPDEEAGEVPKAYLVLDPGVTSDAVLGYVAGHVASFKRIRACEVVEAIPKSPSGKILRRVLRDLDRAGRA
jgi:acyl-CoA synthetase (AMP-forming)/AMP-acid ligase II